MPWYAGLTPAAGSVELLYCTILRLRNDTVSLVPFLVAWPSCGHGPSGFCDGVATDWRTCRYWDVARASAPTSGVCASSSACVLGHSRRRCITAPHTPRSAEPAAFSAAPRRLTAPPGSVGVPEAVEVYTGAPSNLGPRWRSSPKRMPDYGDPGGVPNGRTRSRKEGSGTAWAWADASYPSADGTYFARTPCTEQWSA
jgi:hypothetical protein